jgi:hypothetical protein
VFFTIAVMAVLVALPPVAADGKKPAGGFDSGINPAVA